MVVNQHVLDTLKQIGLNLYERKLWVALLSRGTSTAGELSTLAKVPHSRTYDVLESLAEKGFVLIQATKPLKYVAIPPDEALERAKKRIMDNAKTAAERIDNLKASPVLKELEKVYKKGVALIEPGGLTGALKGRHIIHQQLGTIFKTAKKKISILTTDEGLVDIYSKHSDMLKRASENGVKVRVATQITKANERIIPELKKFAEVKKLKRVKGRFVLADDNHLVFALTDDKEVHPTQDLALWAQSKHVAADMLGPMFEELWRSLPSA